METQADVKLENQTRKPIRHFYYTQGVDGVPVLLTPGQRYDIINTTLKDTADFIEYHYLVETH